MAGSKYPHITPRMLELYWPPIAFCTHFSMLVLIYEALYVLGPEYLKEHLLQYKPPLCCSPPAAEDGHEEKEGLHRSCTTSHVGNRVLRDACLTPSLVCFRHRKDGAIQLGF